MASLLARLREIEPPQGDCKEDDLSRKIQGNPGWTKLILSADVQTLTQLLPVELCAEKPQDGFRTGV
jgi:hypothetical protein